MISAEVRAMQAMVQTILNNPFVHDWSVQGFGMMRTYFGEHKRYRLNIWDSALSVPDVSIVHDHPWDFTSWILAGRFTNVRYKVCDPLDGMVPCDAAQYGWMVIKTGEGGGPDGGGGSVWLSPCIEEIYAPGDFYRQKAEEIHASFYRDGTVTLNDRIRREDGEHARVFWPNGQQWIDAEPRAPRPTEVARTVGKALAQFKLAIDVPEAVS